jgi:hypothetical protein
MNWKVEGIERRLRVQHVVINLQREGVVTKLRLKPIPLRVASVGRYLPAVQSAFPKILYGVEVSHLGIRKATLSGEVLAKSPR